jgi:ribonuclease-3
MLQQPQVLPYNSKNRLINTGDLNQLLSEFGVTENFKDLNLYRKSFVHKSYCTRKNENFIDGNVNCPSDCLPLQEESNERLEFLGDSVLNIVVADYLYERYPDENEGFLTRMRTKLVNGKMLAHLSAKVGLNRFVLISKQIEDNDGRKNLNILEDCFEAFIAAVYLDHGYNGFEMAKTWIIGIIEDQLDFSELIKQNNNFKDLLLKYFQQNHGYSPKFYEMNIETNPINNAKIYTICVKDDKGNIMSIGKGGNKKDAENDSAKKALNEYTTEYNF